MLLECFFWHAPWIWCRQIARKMRHLSDSWSMLEPHFIRSPPIYHWIGLREILQESPEMFSWVKTVKTMVLGEDFPTNPWNFGWWSPCWTAQAEPNTCGCSGRGPQATGAQLAKRWGEAGPDPVMVPLKHDGKLRNFHHFSSDWSRNPDESRAHWMEIMTGSMMHSDIWSITRYNQIMTGNIWLYLVDPLWPMAGSVDSSLWQACAGQLLTRLAAWSVGSIALFADAAQGAMAAACDGKSPVLERYPAW